MTHLVTEAAVAPGEVEEVLRPRTRFVLEKAVGEGAFAAVEGPVEGYRRTVETTPLPDGRVGVRQVVDYRLAVPYFGFLFLPGTRSLLRKLREPDRPPWWAPPQRVDAKGGLALGATALLSWVAGYMGTVLTQTITFAAEDFGAGTGAQGVALAVVRADVLLTVVVVALADRRGRRGVLLKATAVACVLTATGALAPSLPWLAGSQVLARGFVTAVLVLVAIAAVEEMPAGSRAYAMSLLALAAGGGAGTCVLLLQVCDAVSWGWRILYAVPLVGVPVVAHIARHLPESRRFRAPHAQAAMAGHGRRFWLLAVSGFLLNLFIAPANQFQNEYLRTEQGYSAARISLFTVATGTPGFLGIVVGGRLAEHGRRLVGAVAVLVGVGGSLLVYLGQGGWIWLASMVGSIFMAAMVPALGVYGPELFPTALRGKANGIITGTARVGSVVGLLLAGWVGDRTGRLGNGMAVLALGPALLALLVLVAYPETAHQELEDLNPEDRVP